MSNIKIINCLISVRQNFNIGNFLVIGHNMKINLNGNGQNCNTGHLSVNDHNMIIIICNIGISRSFNIDASHPKATWKMSCQSKDCAQITVELNHKPFIGNFPELWYKKVYFTIKSSCKRITLVTFYLIRIHASKCCCCFFGTRNTD